MYAALSKTIAQFSDPAFRGVLLKAVLASLLVFVLLWIVAWLGLSWVESWLDAWLADQDVEVVPDAVSLQAITA